MFLPCCDAILDSSIWGHTRYVYVSNLCLLYLWFHPSKSKCAMCTVKAATFSWCQHSDSKYQQKIHNVMYWKIISNTAPSPSEERHLYNPPDCLRFISVSIEFSPNHYSCKVNSSLCTKKGILLCTMVNLTWRVVKGTKRLMMGGGGDQRLYSYLYNHRMYKKQSISKTN